MEDNSLSFDNSFIDHIDAEINDINHDKSSLKHVREQDDAQYK